MVQHNKHLVAFCSGLPTVFTYFWIFCNENGINRNRWNWNQHP